MKMRTKLLSGIVAGAILLGTCVPSQAYYSKTDYAEWIQIGPNQSAFLIPMTGANQSTQAQFGSQDYYTANKVATKRVQVPHGKLPNTGSFSDYFVPTAQLILVDRAPYNNEWTDDINTGTSHKKEGINVQTKEGMNIELDITIATHVTEENAAKFLYTFGTKTQTNIPPYDPTQQYQSDAYYSATYTSVQYGRSLTEIMDSIGRGEVLRELSSEFAKYTFEDANLHESDIMAVVSTNVSKWMADRGITLDYVGYASPLNFSPEVQKSIDNVFIAHENAMAVKQQEVAMDVLERQAHINLINNIGIGAQHWQIPNLPSFIFAPSNMIDRITDMFTSQVTSVTANVGTSHK
jgi:SPFH domain / Band 7 family